MCELEIKMGSRFNLVESIDKVTPGLPTLIVGVDNATNFNENLSYLNRRLDADTFWTFTRKEKRELFEEDLFYFIEFAYHKMIRDIMFDFIDIILSDSKRINLAFNNIKEHDNVITFIHKKMVYSYLNDMIYGFDLRQVEYIGKSSREFLKKIKAISNVFLQDEKILIEYKKELYMFNDEIKYVPLIYFIRNNE